MVTHSVVWVLTKSSTAGLATMRQTDLHDPPPADGRSGRSIHTSKSDNEHVQCLRRARGHVFDLRVWHTCETEKPPRCLAASCLAAREVAQPGNLGFRAIASRTTFESPLRGCDLHTEQGGVGPTPTRCRRSQTCGGRHVLYSVRRSTSWVLTRSCSRHIRQFRRPQHDRRVGGASAGRLTASLDQHTIATVWSVSAGPGSLEHTNDRDDSTRAGVCGRSTGGDDNARS